MKHQDFLGFMSNLVNCLKLGRNTSLEEIPFDMNLFKKDKKKKMSFTEEVFIHKNKRNVVFILD